MQNGLPKNVIDVLSRPARLIFHQEDDGWWVESPDLAGFYTSGDTLEELQANIYDAVLTYFEVPDDNQALKERLLIKNELATQLQLA
jgi:predicted RNase H-like HicB family nuclease